ncbi:TetR/AcrR family transcriptional regulator [Cyclobacteriaceae bacterium]|nr:TetR/AcrR family transcriptional regulator [Cyclobacteriaceae bacterium]
METRDKILAMAIQVLPRFGVKSVTMDDLAQRLGMSKKTIYQHFKDKSALVEAVVEKMLSQDEDHLEVIKAKSQDAVEEIYLVSLFMREMLSSMDASVIFDLKKYYPSAFDKFECHKEEKFRNSFLANLITGIEQGYYRQEINTAILAKLKMFTMEWSFDPDVFPPSEFKMVDVQMELFDHFLYGILSEKGHEKLKIYKNKYQVT